MVRAIISLSVLASLGAALPQLQARPADSMVSSKRAFGTGEGLNGGGVVAAPGLDFAPRAKRATADTSGIGYGSGDGSAYVGGDGVAIGIGIGSGNGAASGSATGDSAAAGAAANGGGGGGGYATPDEAAGAGAGSGTGEAYAYGEDRGAVPDATPSTSDEETSTPSTSDEETSTPSTSDEETSTPSTSDEETSTPSIVTDTDTPITWSTAYHNTSMTSLTTWKTTPTTDVATTSTNYHDGGDLTIYEYYNVTIIVVNGCNTCEDGYTTSTRTTEVCASWTPEPTDWETVTKTVTETRVYDCPAYNGGCDAGQPATDTVTLTTTYCPATQTGLHGPGSEGWTYNGDNVGDKVYYTDVSHSTMVYTIQGCDAGNTSYPSCVTSSVVSYTNAWSTVKPLHEPTTPVTPSITPAVANGVPTATSTTIPTSIPLAPITAGAASLSVSLSVGILAGSLITFLM